MRQVIYSILVAIISFVFCNCASDDDSSLGDKPLSFSDETIVFDTVFTKVGSATLHFKIYNKNNRSLRIQAIELASKGASGFRLNVDGESGTSFSNVEILKKDSLFTFVEVTVDPSTSADLIIKDSIRFTTNGFIQYVKLEAIGLDVYKWDNETITENTTLTADKPYLIYNTFTVNEGTKLTIPENLTFYFRRNAKMEIYGSVDILGTPDKPVIFRGERLNNISPNIAWNNVPGQWEGITFHASSYNNNLQYATIKNSLKGILFHDSNPSLKKASLTGVTIQNTSGYALFAINCNIDATNCLFANSENATLKLAGGKYNFNFCTIANYYRWSPRKAAALELSNAIASTPTPLIQCNFYNSIIYGSTSDELMIMEMPNTASNYLFSSCLIKGIVTQKPNFENIIWNKDPLFSNLNNNGDLSYDFQPKATSPAINAANSSFPIETDIKGRTRPNNGFFDIGCYEYFEDR